MRFNYKVNVQDGLISNFEMVLQDRGAPKEDIEKLKDLLWNWNNFRATTSWKQQYEFAIALASAYNIGKYGDPEISHYR